MPRIINPKGKTQAQALQHSHIRVTFDLQPLIEVQSEDEKWKRQVLKWSNRSLVQTCRRQKSQFNQTLLQRSQSSFTLSKSLIIPSSCQKEGET